MESERHAAEAFLKSALGIGAGPPPEHTEAVAPAPGQCVWRSAAATPPAEPQGGPYGVPPQRPNVQQRSQPPPGLSPAPAGVVSASDVAALAYNVNQLAQLQARIASAHGELRASFQHTPPEAAQQRAALEMRAAELVQRHAAVTQQLAASHQAHQKLFAALQQSQQQPPPQQRPPQESPQPQAPQSRQPHAASNSPLYARTAQPRPQQQVQLPAGPDANAWAAQLNPATANAAGQPRQPPPQPPPSAPFVPPPPGLGPAPASKLLADAPYAEHLTAAIGELHAARLPPADDARWRRAVVEHVNSIAARLWRGAQVRMFGSSASGLHTRGADLDLCLLPPRPPHINAARRMISSIGVELEAQGMLEVLPLPSARVPIVKFVDRASRLQCDICVNNLLALNNTALLGAYARADGRVRPLVATVKYWAAQRKVNEPYRGTLSSYAYVLLMIGYLQTTDPPVVPSLQQLGRLDGVERIVDGYDVWFCDDPGAHGWSGSANTQSIGELLLGFFARYATEFDDAKHVVSVRLGRMLERAGKVWGEQQTAAARKGRRADRHLFCIEDPFEITHDLGRVMDTTSLGWTRAEFSRAHALMQARAPLAEVCAAWSDAEEKATAREAGGGAAARAAVEDATAAADAAAGVRADDARAHAEPVVADGGAGSDGAARVDEPEAEEAEAAAVAELSRKLATAALVDGNANGAAPASGGLDLLGEAEGEGEPDESAVQLPSGLF